MKIPALSVAILLSVMAACSPRADRAPPSNAANEAQQQRPANASEGIASGDARTPLAEPQGPIHPKSPEAAGQVVQHYGALIEQRRFAEAEKLWGDARAAADFKLQLRRYPESHLEIGEPGDPEGAAGSIYVTVPVVFYGRDQNDAAFRRAADIILRRVNDVPGSTEAQRRWHIERIDWKSAA